MEKASDFDSYISAGVPLTRRDTIIINFSRNTIISTHTPLTRRDKENGHGVQR